MPIQLRIGPDGELLGVRILDDSLAAPRLIAAAVRAVERSAPYKAFAPFMGNEPLLFVVRINYRLR